MPAEKDASVPSAATRTARTIDAYYDQTWLDYWGLWLNRRNLAFHFGYYDQGTRRHAAALLNTNKVLADRVGVRAGERVLDAGCGVGGSSLWLAAHRGAEVVGVTVVQSQVARARRLAARRQLSHRVTFVRADYTSTPFPKASFDVVWTVESLCHAADKRGFYREVARLLRPGGRLVVAEYMRAARPLEPAAERMVREWVDGWAIPDLATSEEHMAYATAAGLENVQLDNFTPRARRSLRRLYRIACACYPFALTARVLRMRSATQHGNVIAAIRQFQALQKGYWLYGVLSARRN